LHFEPSDRETSLPTLDFGEFLRNLWDILLRRWIVIVSAVFAAIVLAVVYVVNTTPVFTANGSILIDPRVGQSPEGSGQMLPGLLMSDALTVDSELRVLTSREVTTATVKALGLKANAESSDSLSKKLTDIFRFGEASATEVASASLTQEMRDARRLEQLRRAFARGLKVQRAGETFVIDISYTSPKLEFAPEAVNTLMREYIKKSSEQQMAMASQIQGWLSGRIEELGKAVKDAETAVAAYRQANQLLVPEGQMLPTEMALTAANEEMVRLRSELLAMEVRVAQMARIIESGEVEQVQIPLEERTQALIEFRADLAELQRQEQELLVTFDETAPAVQRLRQRMDQTRDLIVGEYRTIHENLVSKKEALESQVAATDELIANLGDQYAADSAKTVELRSLEREATSKRDLYERLLEEYNSNSQLLTFEATSARVIAWAVPPDRKSAPNSKMVVVMAAFGALVLSIGLAVFLDAVDSSFRRHTDVEEALGLRFLGLIPHFRSDQRKAATHGGKRPTPKSKAWMSLPPTARRFSFGMEWPTSSTAETLRSLHVKLAMEADNLAPKGKGIVVGFTSSVRDEGKTTTAFNTAAFFAQENERVAILDLDLISREMTRLVWPILPKTNALTNYVENANAAQSNLKMIPEYPNLAVIGNFGEGSVQRFTPKDFEELVNVLNFLRGQYDYIFVDLPPAHGVAETQLLATLCDTLIFVVKWGSTAKEQVKAAIRQRGINKQMIFGVLFTRATLAAYASYNRHDVNDYYYS